MGCSSSYDFPDYESENQKEDYLTKAIYESIRARKRAKIQDAFDAERKEQEDQEKELMRQQYLLNSIDPKGPKSYIDNLINKEIPKMKFGNLASEEEIINDLNDRVCEEYGEDEKEEEDDMEEMTEGEIKDKQEKNKNEMEELKRQLEELNKKNEEEKNKNKKNKNKGNKINKDGFFGKKKDKKENEEQKDEKEKNEEGNNEEKENSEEIKNKKKEEKSNEEEEEEDEIISQLNKKDGKNKKDDKNKKDKNKKGKQKLNEDNNEEDEEEEDEEQEDDFEEKGENHKIKNKNKLKNKKINQNKDEIENEEEYEINKEDNEDIESEESKKLLKKKMLEKKMIKRQNKMKELLKLKAENPSYKDKIKKYKYPKKVVEEKPKADFSPSPPELVICVIGEEKNGKTSFIKKYTRNVFEQTYKRTETIDTYDEAEGQYDSKKIKLTIIDTPPLNDRKKTSLIQDNGINKSHAVIYIVDINDEYADFKVKLTLQNFEFSEKQIIAILGNKSDQVSIFSKKNQDTLGGFCSIRKFFFEIISCQDTPKNEIENFVNEKIINEYFRLYKE